MLYICIFEWLTVYRFTTVRVRFPLKAYGNLEFRANLKFNMRTKKRT